MTMKDTEIKVGSLRVWIARNPPCELEYQKVKDPETAAKVIEFLAQEDLLNPIIESNSFGLEIYDDSTGKLDWSEWADTEGEGINAFIEKNKEHYLLFVYGCVDPSLIGPFDSREARDEKAVEQYKQEGEQHGYYRITAPKGARVTVGCFVGDELEDDEEDDEEEE